MKKIVSFFGEKSEVFENLNEKAREYALNKGFEYKWAVQNPYSTEIVIKELLDADIGIIDVEPYGEEIFNQICNRTKLLVRFGVGYDKVDLKAASKYGIAIARTTGANTTGVAEMALTLMLNCRRKITMAQSRVKSGNWVKDIGNEIIGSTVGIIGFGCIGQRLARLLAGFECRILVYDPFPNEEVIKELGVEKAELVDLFKESDCISIHVPYSSETHHMVNEEGFALMKSTAVIVNTARGNIIDEDALYHALKNGSIAGAGIDVFAREPLSTDSPLISLPNAILTPHVSSQTVESLWNIYKMAVDISVDFFDGKQTKHILNPNYNQN